MKRTEVTVEKLKALGYEAYVHTQNDWTFQQCDTKLKERQSNELFQLVVDAVGKKQPISIHYDIVRLTVRITLPELDNSGMNRRYYLSRPMTDAELEREQQRLGVIREEENGKIKLTVLGGK